MRLFSSLVGSLLGLWLLSGAQAAAAGHSFQAGMRSAPIPVTLAVTISEGQGSIKSNPAGLDCSSSCSATFVPGTTVELVATPAAGSVVLNWGGACAAAVGGTCSVSITGNTSVAVSFGRPTLSVAVQDLSTPPSPTPRGWVTSDGVDESGATSPKGIDCGSECSAAFDAGTVVTLWAIPFSGSVFEGWTGACSGGSVCVVTMDRARSVTARFDVPSGPTDITSNFTVSKNGSGTGTVASGPPGISCGTSCGARYPSNVNVKLTAIAADGSHVAGWSGPCAGAGTATTCVVTVGPANAVTVTFDLNTSARPPAEPPRDQPADPPRDPPADPPSEPVRTQEPAAPAVAAPLTIGPAKLHVVRGSRRAVRIELTLRADAGCRMRLLRRGAVILTRRLDAHAGRNVLTFPAPRQVGAGHYRLEVVLTAANGRRQRLSWPLRL